VNWLCPPKLTLPLALTFDLKENIGFDLSNLIFCALASSTHYGGARI
jgi:hypothetical protein